MATVKATQAGRNLSIITPLGSDKLLATEFSARETISGLFEAFVDVHSKRTDEVAFDKLLGQPVTVSIFYPGGKDQRHFNGICKRVFQGESDLEFTRYRLELVPYVWLLTKCTQSRTFQQMGVPDILKEVLDGFDVSFSLQGTFHPRDYCIQYRESDWEFASRLMEEEGIYYYFQHSKSGHTMMVGNTPAAHAEMPNGNKIVYKNVKQAEVGNDDLIFDFGKSQEITAGKVTLWDHCFEMPGKNLEATAKIQPTVKVGQAEHQLTVAENNKLELYDFPGEYAQRFDGIDAGGGDRPADLQKIFEDAKRTSNIRMQTEAAKALRLSGSSTCRQMSAGFKFTLATDSKDPLTAPMKPSGAYVVTSVSHIARSPDFRTGSNLDFSYFNSFEAIPVALPFRPQRITRKPVMPGATTATVVGPKGEEIFTDKYGRVKVQFHWDRHGKFDANSSCWVRVASVWAGSGMGMIQIPRIGQEVIVDFLEGDPDQPIITGSVYNASCMPPMGLPKARMIAGFKSASYPGSKGFNQMTFDDTAGKELMRTHAQKNQTITVGHDRSLTVNNDEKVHIVGNRTENVDVHEKVTIGSGRELTISAGDTIKVTGGRTEDVTGKEAVKVTGDRAIEVTGKTGLKAASRIVNVTGTDDFTATGPTTWHSDGALKISSGASITLVVGGSSIEITPSEIKISTTNLKAAGEASVLVSGGKITSAATGTHDITGALVKIN